MALEKAVVPISFAGGLDTKTDPRQVIPGKLLLLENAKFQTAKELRKVPGDAPLSINILGSTSKISNGVSLATFQQELVLNDGTDLFSYSVDDSAWSQKGPTFTISMETNPVIRNNYAQVNQDSATHPTGIQAFAWEDSSGGARYTIIDNATKLQLQSNVLISSTAETPKCFPLGNFLIISYYEPSPHRLRYIAVSIANPSAAAAPVDIVTNVNSTHPNFDGANIGTRLFFAYNNDTGGISYIYMDAFLVKSATATTAGDPASVAIAVYGDGAQNMWVTYYNGTAVKTFVKDYNIATTVLATTIVETVANVRNVTGAVLGTTASIFYEISAAITYNHFIRYNTLTRAGVVGTPITLIRSVGLGSKAFINGTNVFIMAAYEGPLQPTYFLVNQHGIVAAKLSPLTGGGLTKKSTLPNANTISPGVVQFSYLQQDFFATVSGVAFFLTGVMQAQFDFNPEDLISVDIGNGLQTTGGFLSSYDGISSVELGYHLFPEQISVTPVSSGGGLSAGTYQYVEVFAWTDNFGQIHRSAPSIPTSVTFSGGTPVSFTSTFLSGATQLTVSSITGLFVGQTITDVTTPSNISVGTQITAINGLVITISVATQGNSASPDTLHTADVYSSTLTLPTLRVTAKRPPIRSPVWLEVYRTQANQTIFYLDSSLTSPTYNDTTVDTVPFTDTQSDESIQGNLQLYTTGGELENISPPAAKLIWQYKNRLILVPYEAQNTWWYSKEIIPGSPVEFTDSFVNNMDQRGGPITAGIQMDDKNIFFKGPIDIFYVVGDGPSSNGLNNDFTQPQRIPTGAGCIDPFLVLMPQGVMYKSFKGFYLLNRALEAQYVGAEVEAFNSANLTSGQLILNDNEVRLTLDNGIMLMYDYFFNQWTTIPQVTAVGSTIFQNQFCYVQPNGVVLQEDSSIFTHNGNFRRIKLITSWLSLAQLQGFQRVYKMLFLGEYKSPHKLKINAAVNFNSSFVQEDYIDSTSLFGAPNYGDVSPYGSESLYGGSPTPYQLRIPMVVQKCQTVQFTLEEIPMLPYGEGLSLSALTLEVGGKKGAFKVIPAHTFG